MQIYKHNNYRMKITQIILLTIACCPQTSVPVPSPGPGVIKELFVQDGDTVKPGQKLCTIDIGATGGVTAAPTTEKPKPTAAAPPPPPPPPPKLATPPVPPPAAQPPPPQAPTTSMPVAAIKHAQVKIVQDKFPGSTLRKTIERHVVEHSCYLYRMCDCTMLKYTNIFTEKQVRITS